MEDSLLQLRNKLEQEKGKLQQLQKDYESTKEKLDSHLELREDIEEATVIIQKKAQETQQEVEFFIEDIVTESLSSTGYGYYKFRSEFVMRRNKTECDLYLLDGDNRINPLDASGGGVVDIITFALRAALWSLDKTHRNTLIWDEPFRNLSKDSHDKAAEMFREVSKKLYFQVIMVTHSEELLSAADKVFEVNKIGKISKVQELN